MKGSRSDSHSDATARLQPHAHNAQLGLSSFRAWSCDGDDDDEHGGHGSGGMGAAYARGDRAHFCTLRAWGSTGRSSPL